MSPTLLRVDSSIRHEGSFSRAVADTFERAWREANPDGTVTVRDLVEEPLPYISDVAMRAGQIPSAERTPEEERAGALAARLMDELLAADALLLGVPLYNYGLPAAVKSWIDHLFADPRVRAPEPVLAGRAAVLVSARGGSYRPGTPREGWDYAEPYLRRILGEVFGLDLQVITPELTLAEVNPALAEFKEHAKVSLREAHEQAETHARTLARREIAA